LRGHARRKEARTDPRQDSSSWSAYGWRGVLIADGGAYCQEAHAHVGWGWAHMGSDFRAYFGRCAGWLLGGAVGRI
jgi:hypothetical protein